MCIRDRIQRINIICNPFLIHLGYLLLSVFSYSFSSSGPSLKILRISFEVIEVFRV